MGDFLVPYVGWVLDECVPYVIARFGHILLQYDVGTHSCNVLVNRGSVMTVLHESNPGQHKPKKLERLNDERIKRWMNGHRKPTTGVVAEYGG